MKFHARSPNNDIVLPTKTVPEMKKLNLAIGQVSASKNTIIIIQKITQNKDTFNLY